MSTDDLRELRNHAVHGSLESNRTESRQATIASLIEEALPMSA